MFSLLKKCFKTGVIAVLLVGGVAAGTYAIAGPDRARAVLSEVHQGVLSHIDAAIDDPSALRLQLQEMEREYPKRISQVRGDLAELDEEIRKLQREKKIADRVVELADADLGEIQTQIAEAAAQVQVQPASNRLRVVVNDRVLSLERASTRAQQIRNTRVAYANQSADADHDLVYLVEQKGRLEELLLQLETERAQFKTQILALSRQVDAIARNERLISLLEKRNETIQECNRYEAVSLDQITGRLASIRSRQEAELDLLSRTQSVETYEDVARMQLAAEGDPVNALSPYVAGATER